MWICLGDPSIELMVVPTEDSGPQKLLCNVWGFSPQVKWLSGSQYQPASSDDIRVGEDGRVAVSSHLSIPQTEWKTGNDFTCQVSDKSTQKVASKNISLCSGKVERIINFICIALFMTPKALYVVSVCVGDVTPQLLPMCSTHLGDAHQPVYSPLTGSHSGGVRNVGTRARLGFWSGHRG